MIDALIAMLENSLRQSKGYVNMKLEPETARKLLDVLKEWQGAKTAGKL